MYKLFLCLRYLRSRVIAYFAMVGVTLCVAMMLIVMSVMNGFVHKIGVAARGLFGDIIIGPGAGNEIVDYDEFIAVLHQKLGQDVEAASPFILTGAFLMIPGQNNSRWTVKVAGIRLPERAAVTDFAKGLFAQGGIKDPNYPTFDPPAELLLKRIGQEHEKTSDIYERELNDYKLLSGRCDDYRRLAGEFEDRYQADKSASAKNKALMYLALADGLQNKLEPLDATLRGIQTALTFQDEGADNIRNARADAEKLQALDKEYKRAQDEGAAADRLEALDIQIRRLQDRTYEPSENHVILGLGIQGLSFRTGRGEVIRYIVPGQKVWLKILPLGRRSSVTNISTNDRLFTVVDDSKTGVYSIDSEFVYVPFDTLQALNNMAADNEGPARCNEIHVKVRNGAAADETRLGDVADRIKRLWIDFHKEHPESAMADVSVQTWRERNADLVEAIEAQGTLMTIILGVISFVAVLLIFVIFYMVVFQKTREIGVFKAVGASSGGVAGIFLAYGAVVGLIGSAAGTAIGYAFVRNINPIADWLGRNFGFQPWNPRTFMFDRIPDEVNLDDVTKIVIWAIVGGLVGALIPAIRAGRMQPVEALRYE